MSEISLLKAVFDCFDGSVCLLGPDGQVLAANAAARALLGCAAEGGALAQAVRPALAGGGLRGADGASLLCRIDPVPGGALLRFSRPVAADACPAELRDRELELRAILDTLLDGVVAIDEAGLIQEFNPAAEALFGYRRAEVLGANVNLLMPPPDCAAHDGYLANYRRTGVKKIIGIGREVIGRRKDASLIPLRLSIGEAALQSRRLFVGVLHDLTAERHAEDRLLTLSRVVEQSPNAVTVVSLDGVVEYVNPAFTRLTGYAAEEAVGNRLALLRSPDTPAGHYQRLWQTLQAGGEWREEIQDRKKNGESYWALQHITPIRNSAGGIVHYLAIQQNITEQKRAQEALSVSEERFRQVAEMSGEWLWEQDAAGRYLYSSGALRQILGYEPEEILGRSYLNLLTDEDKLHWSQQLPETPGAQRPFFRLVNRYRHKDGHEVFTESTGEPIFGVDGKPVKWRGVDHDVTARKHYEDALRLRDRAIEAASVGINIADATQPGYPSIYVNAALSRLTGYSREELLGRDLRLLLGPGTDPAAVGEIARALAEGCGLELVLKNYRKGGEPFWNELLVAPVRGPDGGRPTHFIGVHADVTERRRAEEQRHELEIARQIQLSLLPKAPLQGDGVRVAGVCLPATHVGGDYYDYFEAGGALNVVIADVSGHSVGAALVMAGLRSALKAETRQAPGGPLLHGSAAVLAALNSLLYEDLSGADLFISLFCLRYDPLGRRLCYASGGHNPPLLCRAGQGSCVELDAEGMVLGVRPVVAFEEKCAMLAAGDRLLLYTDGVTEAQSPEGEFFGPARLAELFAAQSGISPEAAVANILGVLRKFCGGGAFGDDVSLVAMNIEGL